VHPGPDGRPLFYELVRSRGHGPFAFYAFDLVWLDGGDLREQPLLERKRALRKLAPLSPQALRYVDHVASGTELFRAICELDTEGIVAKQAVGLYTPGRTSWVR
jgi:bifunctional non-homologous end joining protein LigD